MAKKSNGKSKSNSSKRSNSTRKQGKSQAAMRSEHSDHSDGVDPRRNFKDSMFRMLFGREEYRRNLLSLINAVFGTNYTDPSELEITTIDDVLFINAKNDISLLLDMQMYLFEHQSSVCPNMPVRGLIYFAHLYDKYITQQNVIVYGPTEIKLPAPRYTVLYNGSKDEPAVKTLRLSDSFMVPAEGFEWTATVININSGMNDNILEKCKPLQEYTQFVEDVRFFSAQGQELKDALRSAVDDCIERGILAEFLLKHKAEVFDMCLTEFDRKKYDNTLIAYGQSIGREEGREEGRAEGEAKGEAKGRLKILIDLVQDSMITISVAAHRAGMSEGDFISEMNKVAACV